MSAILDEYPWLQDGWTRLRAYLDAGRIPQALLMTGPAGSGKHQLAQLLASRLLCREPAQFACGRCHGCRLMEAGTHPDLLRVEPEEPAKPITVDTIRALTAALALRPQYSAHRVVILAPAHLMNSNAANSLLKTLEEPERHTVLLLLSERPSALPATIVSRCQRFRLGLPERAAVLDFLAARGHREQAPVLCSMAGGAPLRALELAGGDRVAARTEFFGDWSGLAEGRQQPVVVAEKWAKAAVDDLVAWSASWLGDLIRLKSAGGGVPLDNSDLLPGLQALVGRLHLVSLFDHLDRVQQARRLLAGQTNRQLLLEDLLIRWAWLARPQTGT